jgi:hypothetical protein
MLPSEQLPVQLSNFFTYTATRKLTSLWFFESLVQVAASALASWVESEGESLHPPLCMQTSFDFSVLNPAWTADDDVNLF